MEKKSEFGRKLGPLLRRAARIRAPRARTAPQSFPADPLLNTVAEPLTLPRQFGPTGAFRLELVVTD
jgi:hypothetical protein